MKLIALKYKGWSNRKIGRHLGIDRRTAGKYAANPGLVGTPRQNGSRGSKLDGYKANVDQWLKDDAEYTATRIYDRLQHMGFTGGYQTVKRYVHGLKETNNRVAFLRFETEPGNQAQVDFGDFAVNTADGGVKRYYCFSMILGYSRNLYAELVERCDLTTFLDCHIRAFAFFGGVPQEILYDRMKNVFIKQLAGKYVFNSSLTDLALHCGFAPQVAPAYAPWVKGKVERPYGFIRENFWRGYNFTTLETANKDLHLWLDQKALRVHGTTHERVCDRFAREKPTLQALPLAAFDTSYRAYRTAGKDCIVHFDGNRYMAPHALAGKKVLLRVKERSLRIFADDQLVASYVIPDGKGQYLFESRFIDDLRHDRENNRRKYSNVKPGKARATISPSIPHFAREVEIRPLTVYANISGSIHRSEYPGRPVHSSLSVGGEEVAA